MKLKLKSVLSALALFGCMSSHAFSPANGAWAIDAESGSSAPGRGFSIEVENEILVFTYFGYRADGTSVFFVSAGAMTGNTFNGALNEIKGGTSLGGAYKGGTVLGSAGNVSISFTNGVKGTITLPGESPKAVSKVAFGYSATPDSLLGTYTMTYKLSSTSTIADTYTLSKKLGTSTSTGSGIVSNSTNTFACENQTSGSLAGTVVCTEATGTSSAAPRSTYDDYYIFKITGDRGAGVGSYFASQYAYPSHVIRIATNSGKTTAIVEPTNASLIVADDVKASERLRTVSSVRTKDIAKSYELPNSANGIQLSDGERSDFQQWVQEARTLMNQVQ